MTNPPFSSIPICDSFPIPYGVPCCDSPSVFILGHYCACEIFIANPSDGRSDLIMLLLIKLICH